VGCPNACRFCCTSHFFGKEYVPFVQTGRELFDLACRISKETGSEAFFVMDENFLKQQQRALDMLRLMEKHERWFRFHIFSSADTVIQFGIHNLVRLGVTLIWIGVESRSGSPFEKNAGIDFPALVRSLRDHGIGVLTSGILCLEHHTPWSMQQDIDFLVHLEPDLIQFMLFTALPVTGLYLDLKEAGLLRQDLPLEEWHGQKHLNFHHPRFSPKQASQWLEHAFEADYRTNGSSIGRLVETAIRGARTLRELAGEDKALAARSKQLLDQVREYRPLLPAIKRFAVNDRERERMRELERAAEELLGPPSRKDIGLGLLATAFAAAWSCRLRLLGDRIQPRTLLTRYPKASSSGGR
jgi:haloalkane dehalogenase